MGRGSSKASSVSGGGNNRLLNQLTDNTDFRAWIRENLSNPEFKKYGQENGMDEVKELWREKRTQEELKNIKEMSIDEAVDIAIKLLENAQMHEDNLAEYMKDFNVSREQAEWDLTIAKQENTISYSDGCNKLRDKGYVLYNVEWLKENYQQELDLLGVKKKGKWISKHTFNDANCSICGIEGHASYNYCPICGADMRGEENADTRNNDGKTSGLQYV